MDSKYGAVISAVLLVRDLDLIYSDGARSTMLLEATLVKCWWGGALLCLWSFILYSPCLAIKLWCSCAPREVFHFRQWRWWLGGG